jgi:proteasome lid subunit RPN8/RPN11
MTYYRIERRELIRISKMAQRSAFQGIEICGALVLTDRDRIRLVPVINASKEMGSFSITPHRLQIAIAKKNLHMSRVVGTYHSHPAWRAEPGSSDIEGTWNGALMLIFACLFNDIKLWRIWNGEAKMIYFVKSINT